MFVHFFPGKVGGAYTASIIYVYDIIILRYDMIPLRSLSLYRTAMSRIKIKNTLFRGGRNNSVCANLARMQKDRVKVKGLFMLKDPMVYSQRRRIG